MSEQPKPIELIVLLIGWFLFRGRVKGTKVTDVFKIALESIWTQESFKL
jgi:hypothetical protein